MLPIPSIFDIIPFIRLLQSFATAFSIMTVTPDRFVFGLPGVLQLWQFMAVVANGFMVTFLIIGANQIVLTRSMGRQSITPQELITRFGTQLIAINSSFFLIHTLVNIENGLCTGLISFTLNQIREQFSQNVLLSMINIVLGAIPLTSIPSLLFELPLLVLVALTFIVVLFLVFFQAIMRLIRLNMFLILTPLACLLLTLDQTREYGTFILRLLVVNIFVQFMQVLAFCLALLLLASAFLDGPFGDPMMKLIMVIGQLLGIYSVPHLLSHFGIEGGRWSDVINNARMAARVVCMAAGIPPII